MDDADVVVERMIQLLIDGYHPRNGFAILVRMPARPPDGLCGLCHHPMDDAGCRYGEEVTFNDPRLPYGVVEVFCRNFDPTLPGRVVDINGDPWL